MHEADDGYWLVYIKIVIKEEETLRANQHVGNYQGLPHYWNLDSLQETLSIISLAIPLVQSHRDLNAKFTLLWSLTPTRLRESIRLHKGCQNYVVSTLLYPSRSPGDGLLMSVENWETTEIQS